jgi:ribosomal protein S18 acetylase RimI-like enzyme
MLQGLLDRAGRDGFRALSLSVDRDNPAIGLYESFGFRKIAESGNSWTMLAELGSAAEPD